MQEFQLEYVIHLGANTDLEYCETNHKDAYITNTLAVENVVYIANGLDIPTFISVPQDFLMGKKILMMTGISQNHWVTTPEVNMLVKYLFKEILSALNLPRGLDYEGNASQE